MPSGVAPARGVTTINNGGKKMALKSITMTKEQTETYDGGGEDATQLLEDLREKAGSQCGPNDMVEIYTSDGIVVDFVEAE